MKILKKIFIVLLLAIFMAPLFSASAQNSDLLSEEEVLWLKSRNNTVVVYPERNAPPFSYQTNSGNLAGYSIDFVELVAERLGIKIEYLTPQSKNQIINELKNGKGDVATGMTELPNVDTYQDFIFTDDYAVVPTVIVVRKDYGGGKSLNMTDFNGRKVSVVSGSVLYSYVKKNYPRVILEDVTDDEVSLQKIVLGEVDAGVMDVASLSYFLSKQVLSSVKVVGNVGFDYKPSFMLYKNNRMLQSILEKGIMQVSINERASLNEKWITLPEERVSQDNLSVFLERNFGKISIYLAFGVLLAVIVFLIIRQGHRRYSFFRKVKDVHALKEEIKDLEEANEMLADELEEVVEREKNIHEKIKNFRK